MTGPGSGVMIEVAHLDKTYVLHAQGGIRIPAVRDAGFRVAGGECVVLHGPSGAGKSTLLRCLYGNCRPDGGHILVRGGAGTVDVARAAPRAVLRLRRDTMAYVSQFLRAIPRVPALDVVAEPLRAQGIAAQPARERAARLLTALRVPERLWSLAPATFSGGEQQRVNIARGFVADHPILLLDEPTASLDAANREVVVQLILDARARGTALVGVFHDDEVRAAVASRVIALSSEGVAPCPIP